MPLLSPVGRRRPAALLLLTVIYALLAAGALSMVVPALIMLTASVSNGWDYDRYDLLPWRLIDARNRYQRFLLEKHQGTPQFARDFRLFASSYGLDQPCSDWIEFKRRINGGWQPDLALEEAQEMTAARRQRFLLDYREWVDTLEPMTTLPLMPRLIERKYREFLRQQYESRVQDGGEREALAELVRTWGEARFTDFHHIALSLEASMPVHLRNWMPALNEPRIDDYADFVSQLEAADRWPITTRYLWLRHLQSVFGELDAFVQSTGVQARSLSSVPAPGEIGFPDALMPLARQFLEQHWPLWLIRLPDDLADDWREFLRQRTGSLEQFNSRVQGRYESWKAIPFTGAPPRRPLERNLWTEYLRQLPPELLSRHRFDAQESYRSFLASRYGHDANALAEAYGWHVQAFDALPLRLDLVDACQYLEAPGRWTWTIASLNYRQVFEYLQHQQRAVWNTLLLVVLTILCTLTVNPLAAYALSRFPMRTTSAVILFLLATTAFPAEVAMIPSFLLLRELGLLNSFAALLLPGLANGFAIFLLKGFFDSLPRELYEAAQIDGAGEITMFTRITLPLSAPILAYQSLLAFLGAYGGFMWAFLVCQDPRMWTIMVWIYQFQQEVQAAPYVAMAAFVIVSVPTLIIFMACQRVILRGIVIPSMK